MQRALHNHQLIVFEQAAVGVVSRFVDRGFKHIRLVVQFENDHFASSAVDHAQVANNGRQQLRLTRINQVVNAPFGKLPDFGFNLVKQVA